MANHAQSEVAKMKRPSRTAREKLKAMGYDQFILMARNNTEGISSLVAEGIESSKQMFEFCRGLTVSAQERPEMLDFIKGVHVHCGRILGAVAGKVCLRCGAELDEDGRCAVH